MNLALSKSRVLRGGHRASGMGASEQESHVKTSAVFLLPLTRAPTKHFSVDDDNDHSSSQLSPHKTLTCPKGRSAWFLVRYMFGELLASCRKNLSRYACAGLVLLEMKWAGLCGMTSHFSDRRCLQASVKLGKTVLLPAVTRLMNDLEVATYLLVGPRVVNNP